MKILSVAYPLLPVSSGSGGGAEQILYLVERGLVERGHQSLVIAAQGSEISGQLVPSLAADGEITDEVRAQAQEEHRQLIAQVLDDHEIDLVHFHGLDFDTYAPRSSRKGRQLATLHLPIGWYSDRIFQLPEIHFNCVSQSQAQSKPEITFAVVPNGIDLERYRVPEKKREHLLWLGRICPEKGTDIALRVARQLDWPLIVAGPVHPFRYHQTYFEEQVRPLLDEKRCYVGPVDISQKIDLLRRAQCLLLPSLAPETSSLVAMEAAAAGVPVVAFHSGALPEVVAHGRTGFVVHSEQEMWEAAKRTTDIDPQVCRTEAHSRFDAQRMIDRYEQLYRELCS
jgi:glycosyltransferase involved in cell wall biosynthesis